MANLMLLDTASLYFRAFHAIPPSVTAPDGMPVNAVRGLLDVIAYLIRGYRPERLVACLDTDWRPAFRVAAIPSYKAHRLGPDGEEQVPEALIPQVAVIEQLLDAVGIARLGAAGYEADDVIGTVATRAQGSVDIVTGDRDLFQLVDDARGVRVLYPARRSARPRGKSFEAIDEAAITARYGIPGRAYPDFALLRGDPSDGLPGAPGIGEKTAAALVTAYGNLTGMLSALDDAASDLTPAIRRKLAAARDYLTSAETVVRVATEIPLPPYDDTAPRVARNPDRVTQLSEKYGLEGPIHRLLAAFKDR